MQLSPDKIYEKILDLRTPDEQRRTDAINYIPIIVNALGTARTSDELFPYIVESAIFTEDQWIQVLNALGKIDYTKFTNKQINNIFYTICSICEIESRSIREAFVGCFFSIVQKLKEDIINGILKEFIQTMIDSDSPSIRATAISIYAQSISLFSTQIKSSLFNVKIDKLKEDPAVNVRQSYAAAASTMISYLKGTIATNLYTSVLALASDPSYSVCCEVPSFLVEYMKTNNNPEKVFEIGDKLLQSDNWRVRCVYIASLKDIFRNQKVDFDSIYKIINNASLDKDDEVATAAAEALPLLIDHYEKSETNSKKIESLLTNLLDNNCPHVKTSTAKILPDFIGILSSDFVCNALLKLTKDNSQEVKITSIESLKSTKVPDDAKLKCLSQASETKEWREKESIVKLLPELARESNSDYEEIVNKMLKDDAFAVRKAILNKLPILAARKGSQIAQKVMETVNEMANCDDYQLRQTAALAIIKLSKFDEEGMKIIEKTAKDPVSNVRYSLSEMIPRTDKFNSIINVLKNDPDEDVRSLFN